MNDPFKGTVTNKKVKLIFKAGLFSCIFLFEAIFLGRFAFEKMARANGKTKQKYAKLKKWLKITFRGLILVPCVAFWGFWGLVCIEKLS